MSMRRWTTVLALGLLMACGSGPTEVEDDGLQVVAAIEVEKGAEQSAQPEETMPDSVIGRVMDNAGEPVEGRLVNFEIPAGGEAGAFEAGSLLTNGEGRVFNQLTAGNRAWTARVRDGEDSAYTARLVTSREGRPDEIKTFTFAVQPGELDRLQGARTLNPANYRHGDELSLVGQWERAEDQWGNPLAPGWHEDVRPGDVTWEIADRVFDSGIRGPSGDGWTWAVDTVTLAQQGYPLNTGTCDDGSDFREYLLEIEWAVESVVAQDRGTMEADPEPAAFSVVLEGCS